MKAQRIKLIGVPVDVCREEDLEETVMEILAKPGMKQILFLSVWDLMRARRNKEFRECLENADLILPVSKSIARGAKFLKKSVPARWNPFTATIQIMTILEARGKSIYLLGARPMTLGRAEANVRATFPSLRVVGRYPGYWRKSAEASVVSAIYKSSPSLALLGEGIKEKDLWAWRRRNQFSSSVFLYNRDALEIFAERVKRVSDKTFDKGLEIFSEVFRRPFKIFYVFTFFWYKTVLLWHKLFKRNS